MKGKCYSETLAKFWTVDVIGQKTTEYMARLAGIFDEYKVSDDELIRVLKQYREIEFTGTSYMPLPDEGALIRVIQDVQQQMAHKRLTEPVPVATSFHDDAGRMIFADGEMVVRDRYFFKNMMEFTDLISFTYPVYWLEEAFDMMDTPHQKMYKAASDDIGKNLVLKNYYTTLELPTRKTLTQSECDACRIKGGRWSRLK